MITKFLTKGTKYAGGPIPLRIAAAVLATLAPAGTLVAQGVGRAPTSNSLYPLFRIIDQYEDQHPTTPARFEFQTGSLVVSRSLYDNKASNVTVGTVLPPNCAATTGGCGANTGAPNDGTYPTVFNNDVYDGSFGITSMIFLDEIATDGTYLSSLVVPNNLLTNVGPGSDQLVTSFSSKSELALNLSTDGHFLTFMGYVAPVDALDVSNSNTAGAVDPTNPVGLSYYRAVARVDKRGHFGFTMTNAYSGNNGRAAILNEEQNVIYMAGNAGNGGNPQPTNIILGAGAQIATASNVPEVAQMPSVPTPVANFSISELGLKHDKIGKDTNFRGLTIFNNVIYLTKGSGSNGVNTVYFVDTTGSACPNGTGLPGTFNTLPTVPFSYSTTTGLPTNMCILKGFPTTLANSTTSPVAFPFGVWFADANTVYVSDEGDGYSKASDLFTHAATQTTAGLQKWVFNKKAGEWQLAYILQTGLNLGTPYTVTDYPTGNNPATGLPWTPAADGLRNITGRNNEDGTATIFGITSTVSGNGDQGADPNQLVRITDVISNTDPTVAAAESFSVIKRAGFAEVLRGVSFAPTAQPAE